MAFLRVDSPPTLACPRTNTTETAKPLRRIPLSPRPPSSQDAHIIVVSSGACAPPPRCDGAALGGVASCIGGSGDSDAAAGSAVAPAAPAPAKGDGDSGGGVARPAPMPLPVSSSSSASSALWDEVEIGFRRGFERGQLLGMWERRRLS